MSRMYRPLSVSSSFFKAAQPLECRATRGPVSTVGELDCASSLDFWNGFLNPYDRRPQRHLLQASRSRRAYRFSGCCGPFCAAFCTRSTLPLKFAFSSIDKRAAVRSPVSVEPWRSSTLPDARTSPSSVPTTTTSRAETFADTLAFCPMVSRLSLSVIVPSTTPSTTKSSLPFTSPRIWTDLPITAAPDSPAAIYLSPEGFAPHSRGVKFLSEL